MTNIDRRMFNGSLLGGLLGLGAATNTDPVESTDDKTKTCNPVSDLSLLVETGVLQDVVTASGTYSVAPTGVILTPCSGVLVKWEHS